MTPVIAPDQFQNSKIATNLIRKPATSDSRCAALCANDKQHMVNDETRCAIQGHRARHSLRHNGQRVREEASRELSRHEEQAQSASHQQLPTRPVIFLYQPNSDSREQGTTASTVSLTGGGAAAPTVNHSNIPTQRHCFNKVLPHTAAATAATKIPTENNLSQYAPPPPPHQKNAVASGATQKGEPHHDEDTNPHSLAQCNAASPITTTHPTAVRQQRL